MPTVVDALMEITGCVDVVDVAANSVDEEVKILEKEGCVRLVCVEEDAVLEVETGIVKEDIMPEDVEFVTSDETVDVVDDDVSAV